ncbi:type II and III secretion system protein family protein [Alsobacter sp. R-9]
MGPIFGFGCRAARASLLAVGLIATTLPWSPAVFAQSTAVASTTRVQVPANKSQTVRLENAFSDVLVGSSEIAEVIPLSDRSLYVLGKKVGTTNISVLDSSKRLVGIVDVTVTLDARAVAGQVSGIGGARGISVQSANDRAVLGGVAPDAPAVDRAYSVANAVAPGGVINMARVGSPQQVMLQVRILEVARQAGRDLGIRWGYTGNTNRASVGSYGQLVNVGQGISVQNLTLAAVTPISGVAPVANAIKTITGAGYSVDVMISALEEQGLVRRLAEPNLIAMSGETADFLAGGEFPVPVSSNTTNGFPTTTIEYKEFGVQLAFTPTVLQGGIINLRVRPEVSDIDPSLSVVSGGVAVPGLIKRKANTTVELRDGQSFAIAGLLQAQSARNVDQLPWLGSVPVLGALFRSQAFQQKDTELVVIVTPYLVKPAKPGQPLESPLDTKMRANDMDAFIGGKADVNSPRPTPLQQYLTSTGAAIGAYGHISPARTGSN